MRRSRSAVLTQDRVAVLGAGPAGLFAAEHLAQAGHAVTVFDRMASPARKFLLAGRGGLNITRDEALCDFAARYGDGAGWMRPMLEAFPPEALKAWCAALGQEVFTGSSGRVFPTAMKAAPLLRAWLRRLDALGVRLAPLHRWTGWDEDGALTFDTPAGHVAVHAPACVLALGGASWPRMGADGAWADILRARGVTVAPLRASNCGVCIAWSSVLRERFEGTPLKRIALSIGDRTLRGEAVVTASGLEGGAVYALSAPIRAALDAQGAATLLLDLRPDVPVSDLAARIDGVRGGRSLANLLRQSAGLSPVAISLVQEALRGAAAAAPLSRLVKAVPLSVTGMQGLARAISSSGGILRDAVDENMMLRRLPGVFAAGEMLDWDAPTGGYLLQACFATGLVAGRGVLAWRRREASNPF